VVCQVKRPLLRRDLRRNSNPELAAHVGKAHGQLMHTYPLTVGTYCEIIHAWLR